MPKNLTTVLAAVVVGAAGLALTSGTHAAAATDDTPGYSVQAITVDVKVGPADEQSCRVDADLYLPDGASATHKVPAILTTNGFGGNKADGNQSAIGKGFVQQGYAVISYSGLGFGHTNCKITMDDPDWDGKAGKGMVDVFAGTRPYLTEGSSTPHFLRNISLQKPGDPRLGMIGGSYGGQIQYAVAEQDPRVDTIIPIITWNDLTYSLAPGNVAKKEWVDLFFGDGIVSGVQTANQDPETLRVCPNFVDQACIGAIALNTQGYPDAGTVALAKHASVASYVKRIKIPTLLVQGQKDTLFNLNEAVATYRSLQAQQTPVKMIWQSWGHSDSTPVPGELDFGAKSLRDSYLGNRLLDWMNHYVKGVSSASTGPNFEYYRDWVKYDTSAAKAGTAVGAAYARSSTVSWDPNHTLYFTGGHELTPTRSAAVASSASYANAPGAPTSYSETSGVEGSQVNLPPSDAPGTFVSFTTDPLSAPADVVGSPKVTLKLSTPTAGYTQIGGPSGQLVLFAKIYDIAPDGSKVLKNRLIAPMRVADTNKLVTVRLPGIVHRFATGHRIQVAIAASDAAYAGNTLVQPVAVMSGPDSGSTLGLPVVGQLTFQ
ncbi:CocE/NonD family hydrolase [Marmoricola sp. URHB0036]|uniref:CocE/NonD family hydrolase n=1 Tax=Marmoricola sp. URHB0036 TaxID=1298863 RepID=UPI000419FB7E|nr:CocE/NonD family hydrolase [Marmoricola sp. URHB0036]